VGVNESKGAGDDGTAKHLATPVRLYLGVDAEAAAARRRGAAT
jgi:hypothetical protein